MDKRNLKKPELSEKKTDKKDRGDLKKVNERIVKNNTDNDSKVKIIQPDGGDNLKAKGDKRAYAARRAVEINKTEERSDTVKKKDIEIAHNRNLELEERRKIRERNLKKNPNISVTNDVAKKETVNVRKDPIKIVNVGKSNLEAYKIDRSVKKPSVPPKDKPDVTHTSKDSFDKDIPQRRPVIKTITSKNDATKIYKAVTFVDRNKQKPTAIQVKLPEYKTSKTSNASAAIKKVSKESILQREVTSKPLPPKKTRKKTKLKRLAESPESLVRGGSPPTEVAKWAPSSINKHTRPYYEAWVSTTLAAISKASKKDKLFLEKQHILETFQRALARRPETPDLIHENFNDERYTGRIKVRQR
ncbi:unnamed protein product [Diatraea saccharalis]|uniref:Uncharacterized protein n=1 Tax=Diatraea saccharalis TaxID=40085 RepID=A0A9N9R6Q1_9NEOP|nr:unnamed protein product [Diatraea saccharalis]